MFEDLQGQKKSLPLWQLTVPSDHSDCFHSVGTSVECIFPWGHMSREKRLACYVAQKWSNQLAGLCYVPPGALDYAGEWGWHNPCLKETTRLGRDQQSPHGWDQCLVMLIRVTSGSSALKVLSCNWLFVTAWIVACQALLSMEISRQEYWYGLPFIYPNFAYMASCLYGSCQWQNNKAW